MSGIIMFRGDSKRLLVTIHDGAGNLVDVSGALAIRYGIFQKAGSAPLVSKSLGAGVTVDGAVVMIMLDPADTTDLSGPYVHELEITTATGEVATVLHGRVQIRRDLLVEVAGG